MSVSYTHIACFIDDSEAAARALEHAVALRDATGAKLSVIHVLAPPAFLVSLAAGLGGAPVHDTEVEKEAAEMWLAEEARSAGAEAVLLEGHPASTAVEWARDSDADVLVAASHRGRGGAGAARQLRRLPRAPRALPGVPHPARAGRLLTLPRLGGERGGVLAGRRPLVEVQAAGDAAGAGAVALES